MEVDGHCGISVCHGEGVGSGPFGGTGNKSNVCNEWGELDPKGALWGGLSGGSDYLGYLGGVVAELHAPLFDVGAGDIELVPGESLGILEDLDHLDIVFDGIAENVGDDRRIEFSQYREFFGYEGADPHILETDSVEHPGRGGVKAGSRGAFDRFAGKTLGDEASEAVQVNEVGEFEAVTEGSTGGKNRIPQAQRANFYAEVNGASGAHFVQRISRSHSHSSQILTLSHILL